MVERAEVECAAGTHTTRPSPRPSLRALEGIDRGRSTPPAAHCAHRRSPPAMTCLDERFPAAQALPFLFFGINL